MAKLPFLLVLLVGAAMVAAQRGGNGMSNRANLQYLFDRPVEPLFFPKGDNEEVVFKTPNNFLPDSRFQKRANELSSRFPSATVINVAAIQMPDISLPMQLSRQDQFSPFVPYHRSMAERLIKVLLGMRTYEDFFSAACFCRDRINPSMFTYALSIATLHRNDTAGAGLPLLPARLPEKFFDGAVFTRARQEANNVDPQQRVPLEIPMDYTGTNLDPEHRVAYWREDVGMSVAHWQWHLVYPAAAIVDKDRRGELFYFYHQQIIARYNFERFCNQLGRLNRFLDFREVIPEAYFPKLDSLVASRVWPPRSANSRLADLRREDLQLTFDVQDLERWRDRIFEAIHNGRLVAENGTTLPLDERRGIDLLGNIVEAAATSVNPNLYGNLHNLGHVAISFVHDPDMRHLESFGVMGDLATTMRDPMFYRWHGFVDDIFREHKQTLQGYTVAQLGFNGVTVTGIEVRSEGSNTANEFASFWQQNDINMGRGLDFAPRGPVLARITHLQHSPFSYTIQVQNSGAARQGTVRIFLAPRFDERGTALTFREQRLFYIELDKFQFNLTAGANTIRRRSNDSAVTVPFERTFRDLNPGDTGTPNQREQFSYCGCGWPQHLLLPKGTASGMRTHLFVMVSDFEGDRVPQQPQQPNACSQGHTYCGILGQLYPDNRPMGYPFDRLARNGVNTLNEFLTPNMRVINATIRFTDGIVPPGGTIADIQIIDRFGGGSGTRGNGNRSPPASSNRSPPASPPAGGNRNAGGRPPARNQGGNRNAGGRPPARNPGGNRIVNAGFNGFPAGGFNWRS